jgi:membrane-bound ClpP family serine protease
MTLSLIIGLLLFGIGLVLIEIFIAPGFIVGLIGVSFLLAGLVFTYREYGSYYGNITLLASAFFLGITIILAFRNDAWKRFTIKDVIDGKATKAHTWQVEIGDTGKTISALRPAGHALINGQKIEVHSEGDFILANEDVKVVKRVQNRIIIKKLNI